MGHENMWIKYFVSSEGKTLGPGLLDPKGDRNCEYKNGYFFHMLSVYPVYLPPQYLYHFNCLVVIYSNIAHTQTHAPSHTHAHTYAHTAIWYIGNIWETWKYKMVNTLRIQPTLGNKNSCFLSC